MEKLVIKLVDGLYENKLIGEEQRDNYLYGVEFLVMKIIGIIVLGIIAVLMGRYIETLVFYLTFAWLRKFTNGYHAKNYKLCMVESAVVYFLICQFNGIIMKDLNTSYLVTLGCMPFIYFLSPVQSSSINFSKEEYRDHQGATFFLLGIYALWLFVFFYFGVRQDFIAFFESAIFLDLILVVIGRIVYWKEQKF